MGDRLTACGADAAQPWATITLRSYPQHGRPRCAGPMRRSEPAIACSVAILGALGRRSRRGVVSTLSFNLP